MVVQCGVIEVWREDGVDFFMPHLLAHLGVGYLTGEGVRNVCFSISADNLGNSCYMLHWLASP